MVKFCKICCKSKALDCFTKHPKSKDGITNLCKDCISKRKSEWYLKTRDLRLSQMKDWYELNKDRHLDIKKKNNNDRYKYDIVFKLKSRLRSRLNQALRGKLKVGSSVEDLGCSPIELKIYLESLFKPGMTWDNYGKEWEIDHIRPLSSFDLTDLNQFKDACNFKNLQPLLKSDHYEKTAKERL